MTDPPPIPPLKSLHSDSSLVAAKLQQLARVSTEVLIASLAPGREGSLKTRRDGTILDGHHRVAVLRERGVNVDKLPRDFVEKEVEP